MIYITKEYDSLVDMSYIHNVWISSHNDLEERYNSFIKESANKEKVTINEHWHNIMNYNIQEFKMAEGEYNRRSKKWEAFIKKWTFDYYLESSKLATKQEYIEIH